MLLGLSAIAQKQGNTWYFGDGAGLDFNFTPPSLLYDGQTAPSLYCGDNHIEGTAAISDSSGQILFYSDGRTVWGRDHQSIANGIGLLGGSSSTHAALFVPRPGSDTEYYLFTTDDFCNDLENGLRYSIIDLCEDDDRIGKVRIDAKNIILVDSVAEKLAAVRHANGVDYWVLTHGYFNNRFYAFQLSSGGLGNPVISDVGTVHEGGGPNGMWSALGQMKFSPDGSRIALGAINGMSLLEVFSFNTLTGVVSDAKRISSIAGAYGVAFSPDGSKLYETTILTQYDLNAGGGDIESINASAYQYLNPDAFSFTGGELGPDGKLYLYKPNNTIAVIHNPNEYGETSGLEENMYSLQSSGWVYGFPSFIAGFDYTASGFCNPNGLEEAEKSIGLHLYPNPATHTVRLEVSGSTFNVQSLTITDMLGNTVMNLKPETLNLELDISSLPTGIYTVAAQLQGGQVLRQRLVVGR